MQWSIQQNLPNREVAKISIWWQHKVQTKTLGFSIQRQRALLSKKLQIWLSIDSLFTVQDCYFVSERYDNVKIHYCLNYVSQCITLFFCNFRKDGHLRKCVNKYNRSFQSNFNWYFIHKLVQVTIGALDRWEKVSTPTETVAQAIVKNALQSLNKPVEIIEHDQIVKLAKA